MYEDNEQPVLRRVLLILLVFIVIVTIAWAVIWLVFFQHKISLNLKGKTPAQHTQSTTSSGNQQGSSTNGGRTAPSSGSGSGTNSSGNAGSTSSSSTAQTSSGSSSSSTSPTQLANAGAGNIFVPFGLAAVAGAVLYQLRLRKRPLR